MRLQHLFRVFIRALIWLAEHLHRELDAFLWSAGDGTPQPLERFAESPLTHPWEVICCGPEEIGVGKVESWLAVLLPSSVG